ncbi:MAG: XdhC family protein [Solirubrobacterales bacterium]
MLSIYHDICKSIYNGNSIVLITVLNKEDAFRNFEPQMIVKDDFTTIGSLGGGLFEAIAIKMTKDVFETRESIVTELDSDISCGFVPEVMLEYIDSTDEETLNYFSLIRENIEDNKNFVMITTINEDQSLNREIIYEENYNSSDNFLREKMPAGSFSKLKFGVFKEDNNITVVLPRQNRENAYIFGGGYIAQKLSKITSMLDFNTIILDDREEFANLERFPDADNIVVLKSFSNINQYINIDEKSYVIIVTRGHKDDTQVLGEVLRTNAKYIGMIGSRKKRNMAFKELMERGFKKEELNIVHAPIGLNINGKTPEEITVSIAAELVKVRRDKNE